MELDLSSQGENNFLKKYLFNLKTHRDDGLILTVHHSYSSGESKRYRFIHASFNDLGTCLSVADHKGNVFIIDLKVEKYWQLPHFGLPTLISFSVSRKHDLLISLDSGSIFFCDIETGNITGTLNGHSVPATEISYTDDGYFCLTSCTAEAIVWDLSTCTQIHRLSLKSDVFLKKVVFLPVTNHILACFQDDTMNVWQFGTFECIKQIIPEKWKTHHLRDVALTRNGRAMVIGGHAPTIVIFCLDTWAVKKVVEFPENISGVKQLEFVPQVFDGGANKILAILTTSLEIYFFDIETSTFLMGMHQIFGMTGKIAVSCTGKYLASLFTTGEVNIYAIEKVLSRRNLLDEENIGSGQKCSKSRSNSQSRSVSGRSRRTHQKSGQTLNGIRRQLRQVLDLKKLHPILKQFGEYPESYRRLIWKTILRVPGNQESFVSLSTKACHSSYVNLEEKYPLVNKSLCNSLKKLLSNLSHWCPLFGEVNFLPEFAFPFVKLFHSDPLGCFEVVATILVNWCQNWFEFYPFPPINMLSILENVLGHHDPDLLEFYLKKNVTSSIFACSLFHTAFSEVLSKTEWLKLWDHVLSNEPSFLFMAIVAYNVVCRNAIKSLKDAERVEAFFRKQNPIDMKMLLSKTYFYLKETPDEIHSRQFFLPFRPLASGGTYSTFLAYPKLIVDSNVEKLQAIRKEEESILEEQLKALSIRKKLDKKLETDGKAENEERIYRELESKMRETVEEEEDRILRQRRKLRNLRQELRLKELEVLEGTRDKILRDRQKRKELELERLIQGISKQRAREKIEVDVVEEEIRKYYSELLLKKRRLEMELGAFESENESGADLERQREKLKNDLRELENEWSSLQRSDTIDISNKMTSIKRLINDLETEFAREIVKRESGDGGTGIERLKKEVESLESQIEKLLLENLRISRKKQERKFSRPLQPWPKEKSSGTSSGNGDLRKPTEIPVRTESNSCGRKGDGKPASRKFKRTIKTTSKRIFPGPRSNVRKITTTRSRQKEPRAGKKEVEEEGEGDGGRGDGKRKSKMQKPKSKLTCRRDCIRFETGDFAMKNSKTGLGEFRSDEGTEKEKKRVCRTPEENCVCGRKKTDCRIIKSMQIRPNKDYSFESDSENEIFKSTLRTRKQIIEEAKSRQGLR